MSATGFLHGKRALIVGIASTRSLAYGIARAMHAQGAELALSYQNDKLKSRVLDAAEAFDATLTLELDVASDRSITDGANALADHWDGFDILVHAVGFAPRDQLSGRFIDSVTREGYSIAHDVSAYSLVALTRAVLPQLRTGGSVLTLSYLGAERSLPNYNVMGPAKASLEACVRFLAKDLGDEGLRVNAISAGPVKTLAAAGIGGFRDVLNHVAANAPLQRNITQEDVGNAAAFLSSDLAAGITGETLHVDGGYHTVAITRGAE